MSSRTPRSRTNQAASRRSPEPLNQWWPGAPRCSPATTRPGAARRERGDDLRLLSATSSPVSGRYRRGAQARARLLRPAPCSKRPVCLKLVGGSPTTSSPSTPSVGPAAHAPPNASGAVLESRSRQPTFPRDPQQANTLDASRSPGGSANGAGAQVVQSWFRSGYLARVWTTRPRLLPRVLRFRGSDCLGRSAMRPIRVDRSSSKIRGVKGSG